MNETVELMRTLMEANSELLDHMVLRTKRKYISHLSEKFGFSRMDLENAWELIQAIKRPGRVPGILHSICAKFRSEGSGFSIERIAEAMVVSSGSIEA